jgi:hypothetical protein
MDIKEFINLCAGKWFSQRTGYRVASGPVENNKSEITIDLLPPDHPEVSEICQEHHFDSDSSIGGLKATWDNSVDSGRPKQTGSSLVVFLPEPGDISRGHIARAGNVRIGTYHLGNDEALTLTIEDNGRVFEERVWFPGPNLRLRTSLIQNPDNTRQTLFYSEIRRIPAPAS